MKQQITHRRHLCDRTKALRIEHGVDTAQLDVHLESDVGVVLGITTLGCVREEVETSAMCLSSYRLARRRSSIRLTLVDEQSLSRHTLVDVAEPLDDGVLVARLARKEADEHLRRATSRLHELASLADDVGGDVGATRNVVDRWTLILDGDSC